MKLFLHASVSLTMALQLVLSWASTETCTEIPTDTFYLRTNKNGDLIIRQCQWLDGRANKSTICNRTRKEEKDGITYFPAREVCKETCSTCPVSTDAPTLSSSTSPSSSTSSAPSNCIDSPTPLKWRKNWNMCSVITVEDCKFEKVSTHCPLQCDKCNDSGVVCGNSVATFQDTFQDKNKRRDCGFLDEIGNAEKNRLCEKRSEIFETCRGTCQWCKAQVTTAPTSNVASSKPSNVPSQVTSDAPTPTPTSSITNPPSDSVSSLPTSSITNPPSDSVSSLPTSSITNTPSDSVSSLPSPSPSLITGAPTKTKKNGKKTSIPTSAPNKIATESPTTSSETATDSPTKKSHAPTSSVTSAPTKKPKKGKRRALYD